MGGCSEILVNHKWVVSFCHIAAAMESLAFLQTDITKLRLFESAASLVLLVYTLVITEWDITDCHAIWSLLHVVVNVFRLVTDKYKANKAMSKLTPEEKVIKEDFFPKYSNLQYVELKQRWEFKILTPGDVVCREGKAVEFLVLVYSGSCQVTVDDRFLGTIGTGQYIGEMAYFTGEPASATVVASNNVCLIQWPIETVRKLSHSHRHTACAQAFAMLPTQFCRDLAAKLAVFNKTLDDALNEGEQEGVPPEGGSSAITQHASDTMVSEPPALPSGGGKRGSVAGGMKIGTKVPVKHNAKRRATKIAPDGSTVRRADSENENSERVVRAKRLSRLL